jgi:hypothetical protein
LLIEPEGNRQREKPNVLKYMNYSGGSSILGKNVNHADMAWECGGVIEMT